MAFQTFDHSIRSWSDPSLIAFLLRWGAGLALSGSSLF